jgi:predicted Zn-dependent protease
MAERVRQSHVVATDDTIDGAATPSRSSCSRSNCRRKAAFRSLAERGPYSSGEVYWWAQSVVLPVVRAQLALNRNDSAKAIEIMQVVAPYELSSLGNLQPVFVRGEAYLVAHQGSEAAAEFQKILDHRGVVENNPIGALAHLGRARAYALKGDTAKARAAYQDFLTVGKSADPNIPILKQAKAEYAKLQ